MSVFSPSSSFICLLTLDLFQRRRRSVGDRVAMAKQNHLGGVWVRQAWAWVTYTWVVQAWMA